MGERGDTTRMISTTATAVRVRVRVQPRSARSRVVRPHGGALKLQVHAAPVDGAANDAVLALLADWLGVPRRRVAIVQGHAARDKVVEIACDDPAGLAARIAGLSGAGCVDKVEAHD